MIRAHWGATRFSSGVKVMSFYPFTVNSPIFAGKASCRFRWVPKRGVRCPSLTRVHRSVITITMNIERAGMNVFKRHRWLSVLLFVTVFSLPFHFHAASALTSQITKECSCVHGTRTQIGLTAVALQCVPALQFNLQAPVQPQLIPQILSRFQAIRAPPAL